MEKANTPPSEYDEEREASRVLVGLCIFAAAVIAASFYWKKTVDAVERVATSNRDVTIEYARRVASPAQMPFANWGGVLAALAHGVVVPPNWKGKNDFDRWVERGVLVTAELRFSSQVPTWSGFTRRAFVYRLRQDDAPGQCPVGSFPAGTDFFVPTRLYGWSSLSFAGRRLRVEGVAVAVGPYLEAARSDHPRLTLKRILVSGAPYPRYLVRRPACYLASGVRWLLDALKWTDFLFKEKLVQNIMLPDGRPALLKRPALGG